MFVLVEVTVRSAEVYNERYDKGVQVKYCVRGEDEPTETAMVVHGGRTPQFNKSRIIAISCVVEEHLDYFDNGCITFLVYGKQVDSPPDKRLQKMTTRVCTQQCRLITNRWQIQIITAKIKNKIAFRSKADHLRMYLFTLTWPVLRLRPWTCPDDLDTRP